MLVHVCNPRPGEIMQDDYENRCLGYIVLLSFKTKAKTAKKEKPKTPIKTKRTLCDYAR